MPHKPGEPDLIRKAFNEGCDDRLAGRPQNANRYHGENKRMATFWLRGWRDVDQNWAKENNKWQAAPLPGVAS